jgi:hypothetical protein
VGRGSCAAQRHARAGDTAILCVVLDRNARRDVTPDCQAFRRDHTTDQRLGTTIDLALLFGPKTSLSLTVSWVHREPRPTNLLAAWLLHPEAGLMRKHRPAPVHLNTNPLEQRLCAFDFDRLKLVGAKTEEL